MGGLFGAGSPFPLCSAAVAAHSMAYRFPAILMVLGWGFLVKSVLCFCFP